jgi:hypothetical protein
VEAVSTAQNSEEKAQNCDNACLRFPRWCPMPQLAASGYSLTPFSTLPNCLRQAVADPIGILKER